MPRPLSATPVTASVAPTQAVILWTECLHGAGDLRDAMIALTRCTRAESAVLMRASTQSRRPRILSSYDCHAGDGAVPLTQPLGLDLISIPAHRARTGSLWSLRDPAAPVAEGLAPAQLRWLAQRAIADVIVIVLGQSNGSVDLLELHLPRRADLRERSQIDSLAEAMAFAWNRRPVGRVARLMSNTPSVTQRLQASTQPTPYPLSSANPWQLTATELRICSLIRDGLAATDIVSAFGMAESTVRSHLRNIYAKAGVSGQVGLVHKLLDGSAPKAVAH